MTCDFKVPVDTPHLLSPDKAYCNVSETSSRYADNLFAPNSGRSSWDVFMHTWNTDVSQTLIDAFHPTRARFDNYTEVFRTFNESGMGILEQSRAYSMSQALQTMLGYANLTGTEYSHVVLMRPDVLFFKPLLMGSHDPQRVYHDSGNQGTSDFFFIMSLANARKWATIYDSLPSLSDLTTHAHARRANGYGLCREFARTILGTELLENYIVPGQDEEVYRKWYFRSIGQNC